MKYYILALCFFFTGCSQSITTPIDTKNTSSQITSIKTTIVSKDIFLSGNIASGIYITQDNKSAYIKQTGETIVYDKIFSLSYLNTSGDREYMRTYIVGTDTYQEYLGYIHSSLSFVTYDVTHEKKTIQQLCTPDYQEGINYKPKTQKIIQKNKEYFLTYALFDISGPDTVSSTNYQAEICFVKDDRLYRISLGDPEQYSKDIVNSFTIL